VARIFGYTGPSWLGQVARSAKEADARALLRLLSPGGALLSAMYSADADGSALFLFPRERLPAHTQMMLATPAGRAALGAWPQYARAVGLDPGGHARIQVGVFQYFCYWFAFYAIKGGDGGEARLGAAASGAGFGGSVRRAAGALHLTRGRDADPASRHPYLALLRQLLLELLPRPAGAAGGAPAAAATPPARGAAGSPFLRASPSKRAGDAAARGRLFYSTLCEFWLTDPDQPVAVPSAGALADRGGVAAGAPLAAVWATTYQPPSEDSLEALAELVRYATAAGAGGAARPAQAGPPWLPPTPVLDIAAALTAAAPAGRHGGGVPVAPLAGPPRLGAAAQPGAQALARQLFRLFHRALTMWPDQRSIKPLLRPLMAYLAPWQADAAAPASATGGAAAAAAAAAGLAGPSGAALASQLTARATGLVHRVNWLDGGARGGAEGAEGGGGGGGRYGPEWEAHVLSNLPFYLALVPLFLELSLSRVAARGESAVQDVVTVVGALEAAPALVDLLRRVDRDLARCAASAPRRGEGPYAELLPWAAEQAHGWQAAAAATALGASPACAAAAAPAASALFATADGGAAAAGRELLDLAAGILKPEGQARLRRCLGAVLPLEALPAAAAQGGGRAGAAAAHDEAIPRLPRSTWREVRYRGDPLRRPVASYEFAPLVRALVALSAALNAWLGLDRAVAEGEEPPENRAAEALVRLRRAGWRVDLRPLADVRALVWVPVAWVALRAALRALLFVWWALTAAPAAPGAATPYRPMRADEWDAVMGGQPPGAEP
jgi:hypothetical protein